ncbi:MAG: LysM peptidoglycan-binding domain-containing protein [Pseudomonadales bacterium]|nr:LysM peptidoglycan-binding domain-containing protein [Pseudomonadales bacterium]
MRKFLLSLVITLSLSQSVLAADSILKPNHPDHYAVQEGDTLWDIASMFLTDAWMWPEIWHVNPDIENPHLIFPGDQISLNYVDGKPQLSVSRGKTARTIKLSPGQPVATGNRNYKLKPRIRSSKLASSIPAIPLDAIASMLTTGRIVEQHTLANAPYILAGKADRLVFGPGDGFYARGEWPKDQTTVFGIFREGEVYLDPETREVLGFEAIEVGTATIEDKDGDLYTFSLGNVKQDVRLGDRLLPTEERRVESTFYPKAPSQYVEGVIMTVLGGVTQVGQNDVVAINRGTDSGLEVGDILAINKAGSLVVDRVQGDRVQLPSVRAGILLVFRNFEKMSYGLVLETEEPLRVGDVVQSP